MASPLRAFAGAEHEAYFLDGRVDAVALLVHGFPGTPDELRVVGAMIQRAGLSVAGMLLPGFGSNLFDVATYSQDDWLAAVLDELASLRKRYARVLLVGNSMGSSLAIQAAAQSPVDGLLLFAPWWRIKQRWLNALYPPAHALVPRITPFSRAKFTDPRLRRVLLDYMPDVNLDDPEVQEAVRALRIETGVVGEVRRSGHLAYCAAPQVAAPTLIIQGARDILVVPAVTTKLARRLPHLVGIAITDGDHEFAHMANAGETFIEPLVAHFAQAVANGMWAQQPLPVRTQAHKVA